MKNNMIMLAALLLSSIFTFTGCDSADKGHVQQDAKVAQETEAPAVKAPSFNADSASKFVAKQVSFGPRIPNTQAATATGDWIISKLKEYGAKVQVQEFEMRAYDGKMLHLRNIIGSYNPEAAARVLVAAHWDTRPFADRDENQPDKPFDGANDGASGVGILLEMARTIHGAERKPDVGVDMIFFDGEDYGQPENSGFPYQDDTWCLGAQYWAKHKHEPNYTAKYGILLDMVGADNAKFAREATSLQYAKNVVDKVWKAANKIGYSDYFKYVNSPGITDDHAYVNSIANIPMIDIIEYNMTSGNGDYFGPYHHRHADSMAIINPQTLKAVGQTVLHVLYNE
jgi:Zn-dependent M28 family amino/carboxypeptidase